MNEALRKKIEEARARTQAMLARVGQPEEQLINTQVLPDAIAIAAESTAINAHGNNDEQQAPAPADRTITINGNTFNPYQIEVSPGNFIQLNEQQSLAVKLFGLEGKTGCLIGPAGTGKTTTMKAIFRAAIMSGRIPIMPSVDHKYIKGGLPGIYGGSFTRIATRNLRDNTPKELQANIHTIHRLLEYQPEFKDVFDEKTQKWKSVRYFVPTRHRLRPLPAALKFYAIDEGSMVGTVLHTNFDDARPRDSQVLYIGDIAQLPPVMDDSILGYKLLELPVVELTEVYRHAGAIVELANYIRTGNTIPEARTVAPYASNLRRLPRKTVEDSIGKWCKTEDGSTVTIHLWKNRLEGEVGQLRALQNIRNFFVKELEAGNYDPNEHMILMPYNKAVGTIETNKYLADYLGKKREAVVHEVIAGFNKHYFAVGDKVFYDREESVIVRIAHNGMYAGKLPQQASVTLDRWGHNQAGRAEALDGDHFDSIDALLHVSVEEDEERKNQASHIITVKKLSDFDDDGQEYTIETSAEVNNLIGGYALTIHKAQGSQWQKVYCIFHNSHNRNLQRELLYTAITRAQKELYVIAEPETFIQGVLSQHIVGNSLKEKAEYFKGKARANGRDQLFNQNTEDQ